MSLTGSLDLREASEAGGISAPDAERNKSTAEIFVSNRNSRNFNPPYIHRVYQNLRDINPLTYEPNIIAIGPYHRGKDRTLMMEKHKERCLESILHWGKTTKDAIISAVAEISGQAMAAYADYVEIYSSEFVKMLVMDGCFILKLMIMEETDPILEGKWMMCSVQRDLILFENQIPFFVLCKIYDVIKGSDQQQLELTDYLLRFFESLAFGDGYRRGMHRSRIRRRRDPEDIKHLLDLIHGNLEPWAYRFDQDRNYRKSEDKKHLLDIIHGSLEPWQRGYRFVRDHYHRKPDHEEDWIASPTNHETANGRFEKYEGVQFIGSATELEEANVRFEKRDSFRSILEIEFAAGILRIPTFTIEVWTKSIFKNFIAYEHHNPVRGRNFFTDYALFFLRLINSPADAKLLQSKGIIDNRLVHETVASFAKKITESVPSPKRSEFLYTKTFDEINKFCHNKFNRYLGILKRDYFNSPWSIISFVAAAVLLLLTFLSTVFTAMQTFKK